MERSIGILLADCSEDFRTLLAQGIAQEEGLHLLGSTGDGEEAVAMALQLQPDVLVMDVLLTQLDGIGVLRQLRESGHLPRTVVVSAFLNDSIAAEVNKLGAGYCVTKPCRLPELLDRIRSCAEDGGLRAPVSPGAYDADIVEVLVSFGVMHHLNGYRFLQEGIRRTIEDPGVLQGITKILYPELARCFHTTAIRVERSMRSALETAWESGDTDRRNAFFGAAMSRFDKRPSNSEFLAMSADFIRLKQQKKTGGRTG